jgi:hypothetical protein
MDDRHSKRFAAHTPMSDEGRLAKSFDELPAESPTCRD